MAWNTPTSVSPGDAILASLYNEDVVDNLTELAPFFSGWTSWTPAIVQGGAVTSTVDSARYLQIGNFVIVAARINITGTGSAGNAIACSLPVTPQAFGDTPAGSFIYFRFGVTRYVGVALLGTFGGGEIIFHISNTGNPIGADPNFATANLHELHFNAIYEAA